MSYRLFPNGSGKIIQHANHMIGLAQGKNIIVLAMLGNHMPDFSLFFQERYDVFLWHRLTYQVTLYLVTAKVLQKAQMLFGFYAFGYDLKAQAVAHGNNGADDGGIISVVEEIRDKRAVYFYPLEREPLQVTQRRVAYAEVIDGYDHAVA